MDEKDRKYGTARLVAKMLGYNLLFQWHSEVRRHSENPTYTTNHTSKVLRLYATPSWYSKATTEDLVRVTLEAIKRVRQ